MPLCNNIIKNCYYFVIPLALTIAIFPTMFLRIYTDTPDLIANALPSLWVMLSAYIVAVPAFVYFFGSFGNRQYTFNLIYWVVQPMYICRLYRIYCGLPKNGCRNMLDFGYCLLCHDFHFLFLIYGKATGKIKKSNEASI